MPHNNLNYGLQNIHSLYEFLFIHVYTYRHICKWRDVKRDFCTAHTVYRHVKWIITMQVIICIFVNHTYSTCICTYQDILFKNTGHTIFFITLPLLLTSNDEIVKNKKQHKWIWPRTFQTEYMLCPKSQIHTTVHTKSKQLLSRLCVHTQKKWQNVFFFIM